MTVLTLDQVETLCRPGTLACCAYVANRGGDWICLKAVGFEDLRAVVKERLLAGTMRATGDNCSGPPSFVRSIESESGGDRETRHG